MLSAKLPDRGRILTGSFTTVSHYPLNLNTCTKPEICASFENAYDLNESLFTSLNDDSVFYKCPDRLRLPLIFYYGHTAVVYVNKLKLAGLLKERLNFSFETMFETGVDEMSWDDTENFRMGGSYNWPTVDEVVEYRRRVRAAILELIEKTPLQLPITMESPWWAVMMGIDHERIHFETSSVLIRQLPVSLVHRPQEFVYAPVKHGDGVKSNPMVAVVGGPVVFGKPEDYPSYGWDNEYGRAEMSVADFECSRHLITNGQYLTFVRAGGYRTRDYWSREGWEWVQYKQARHPVFWVCQKGCQSNCGSDLAGYSHCQPDQSQESSDDVINGSTNGSDPVHETGNGLTNENGENGYCNGFRNGRANGDTRTFYDYQEKFRYRATFDVMELPVDWPVDVNFHEAKAYCQWLGQDYRLPTEAEYQCIRVTRDTHNCTDRLFQEEKDETNISLKHFSSSPVNMYPANEAGFTDSHGNVWQWLEDDFNGLPGFKTHKFYDDFSIPQFKGEHSIIVGGSWVSTSAEASTFARYAFRRHFFQHAGFRVCRNVQEGPVNLAVRMVDMAEISDQVREPPFNTDKYKFCPVPSADPLSFEEKPAHVIEVLSRDYNRQSVLAEKCHVMMTSLNLPSKDLLLVGCETGRLAFEFSKFFQEVIAVDHCGGFLDVCQKMRKEGRVQVQNGVITEFHRPEGSNPERLIFKQFTWLPNEVGLHKLVVFNNIDRVTNTKAYTVRFPELVLPGGLLVVVSRNQWKSRDIHQLLNQHFTLHDVFKDDDVNVTVLLRNDVI